MFTAFIQGGSGISRASAVLLVVYIKSDDNRKFRPRADISIVQKTRESGPD